MSDLPPTLSMVKTTRGRGQGPGPQLRVPTAVVLQLKAKVGDLWSWRITATGLEAKRVVLKEI